MEYRYDLWSMYSGRERLILHSESDEGKHFVGLIRISAVLLS